MSKIYLSFLGTNNYLECCYRLPGLAGLTSPPTRFVQTATLALVANDWTSDDRILVFTTELAHTKNWVDNGHKDGATGLKTCIEALNLALKLTRVPIPEGHSEGELWEIFQKVVDYIVPGAEVMFDITHAFRSIPMLAIVVLNYAKALKSIRLRGIYYGAFEQLGAIQDAKKIPPDQRVVDVLDLTAPDRLLDWSIAIDRFLAVGDAVSIKALAQAEVVPLLKESMGKNQEAAIMNKLAGRLTDFSMGMRTCRGQDVGLRSCLLKEALPSGKDGNLVKPLQPLISKIRQDMDVFNGDLVNDGLQAARWCLERKLIQQGLTFLRETVIHHWLIKSDLPLFDRNIREEASGLASQLAMKGGLHGVAELHPSAAIESEQRKRLVAIQWMDKDLIKAYQKIAEYRNDINHAGFSQGPKKAEKFEPELKALLEDVSNRIKM